MSLIKLRYRRIRIHRAVLRSTPKNTPAHYNHKRLLRELYKNFFGLVKACNSVFSTEISKLTDVALSENSYWLATKRK